MTDNGRMIINARGETAQIVPTRNERGAARITLRAGVRADAITEIPNGGLTCFELAWARDEAIAMALKILDAAGMIGGAWPKDREFRG